MLSRKLIALFLVSVVFIAALTSCKGEKGNGEVSESGSVVESQINENDFPPSGEIIASKLLPGANIGLLVSEAKTTASRVAFPKADGGNLRINAYGSGEAFITVSDCFGHTAEIKVTVDASSNEIKTEITKEAEDFIEVSRDFGARGDGVYNCTGAFQRALNSAKPGETVYVYPGRYKVTLLVMREGVTLQMATTMKDAKTGYTDEIKNDFDSGKIAILSGTRIQNGEDQSYGRDACSNFKIIGGAIDTNLTARSTLIFGCANNVVVENVIFKDMKGNHTIQLTGSKNVVVRNCMFAGYACGDVFTREVIQVEPSTPGATGAAASAPLKFEEGEFVFPENITIEDCYFGKSDEAGAPLIAIGHHTQRNKASVDGFYIKNNVFDDLIYSAIRYNNIVNVEITGNTFLATSKYKYDAGVFKSSAVSAGKNPPAFIILYSHSGNISYTSGGKTITKAVVEEQPGLHNILIENNTFTLEEGTDKRVFLNYKTGFVPGAIFASNLNRQEHYDKPITSYSGFIATTNYASDISFSNNTINIEGQPTYKDHYVNLSGIYDLDFSGNKINIASSAAFILTTAGQEKGVKISEVASDLQNKLTITTKNSDKTITLKAGDSEYILTATFTGKIYINKTDGVEAKISTDANGNLKIELVAPSSMTLDGITVDGKAIKPGKHTVTAGTKINISFK